MKRRRALPLKAKGITVFTCEEDGVRKRLLVEQMPSGWWLAYLEGTLEHVGSGNKAEIRADIEEFLATCAAPRPGRLAARERDRAARRTRGGAVIR